jgi:hypothetical protein
MKSLLGKFRATEEETIRTLKKLLYAIGCLDGAAVESCFRGEKL